MTFRGRLTVLFILSTSLVSAQVTWENQAWTSVQAEKKLFRSVKAAVTLESRWNLNPVMAVKYFPDLALQYKWADFFSTTVHYRYITGNKGLGVREASHRLMLDAVASKELQKTELAFRIRAGREDEPGNSEGLLGLSQVVIRQKLSVKRKFFKQEFSLSVEQFETITGNDVAYDQRRYTFGSEIKMSKQHFMELFIMYQDLIATRRLNFGAGYIFKFKN